MRRPRLAEFIKRMEPDSVAIIPSARETVRSNDTHHRFRQDSDFYYLTGFDEPESIAVIRPGHKEHPYALFVPPRDPEKETWEGRRAGVEGAVAEYNADAAFPISEFAEKLGALIDGAPNLYYRLGVHRELDDQIIKQITRMRAGARRGVQPPEAIIDHALILHEMRLIKTEEELRLMQRAVEITVEAHREAMGQTRPGIYEYELEALIDHTFRRNGAAAPAYNSIIGGGANATVLHYSRNDQVLGDGDLVLVDAGAEYQGYAADITRTFPVNGRFTSAQRDIYNLVLDAEVACIEMVKPGIRVTELYQRSVEILTEGMVRLGLLTGDPAKLIEEGKHTQFYMHRLGHFIGMDVHDVGRYFIRGESRQLEAGMVKTIEPGLYIQPNAEGVPDKYRGIGVRIEDDVLVTADGCRVLTSEAPKQIEEIEELVGRRV